jgi:prepilin-type N-terminal cleavage/methylation domain-containing protein
MRKPEQKGRHCSMPLSDGRPCETWPLGPRWRRDGLTMIETIVVIALISALACVLLPAVQSAREAARQAHCRNNLRQIALAIQSYEAVWGAFPPSPMLWPVGAKSDRYVRSIVSMHALTLPWLEQTALFNAINFSAPPTHFESLALPGLEATSARTVVPVFLCPLDSWAVADPYGPTNYRANLGDCGGCGLPGDMFNGAFNRRGTRSAEFTDGLSGTLLLSEKLVGGAPPGVFVPMRDWIFMITRPGGDRFAGPDAWSEECASLSFNFYRPWVDYRGGRSWMLGQIQYTGFTTAVTPNSVIPDCGQVDNTGVGAFAARSLHPALVHVAMADGSVRAIGNGINLAVWRALGTRRHAEVVSGGSY